VKRGVVFAFFVTIFLWACGASEPVPDWTIAAFHRLEDFKKAYLEGNEKIGELQFQKAVGEIKKSGDLDILAKAYLTRMAVRTACLEPPGGEGYRKIAEVETSETHRVFHDFLAGKMGERDILLLPERYREAASCIARGDAKGTVSALRRISDPLSRLIAAGVAVKTGSADEETLQLAVATASREGWKKALLAYLERLRDLYEKSGHPDKAEAIARRMALLSP